MCGRYSLAPERQAFLKLVAQVATEFRQLLDPSEVFRVFDRPGRRQFNIVPTSLEPILRLREGRLALETAHWWLLPAWTGSQVVWKRNKNGEKTFCWRAGVGARKTHFNSRKDTLTAPGSRYWNDLLDRKRCLVPADGFMEWPDEALRPKGQEKIPRYFTLHERPPFFFAGVYDEAIDDEGKPFLSYNIVTVEPNALLRGLPHHRMPAILAGDDAVKWLDPRVRTEEAAGLLKPWPEGNMTSYAIANLVNSPANESPEVLMPRKSRSSGEQRQPTIWD